MLAILDFIAQHSTTLAVLTVHHVQAVCSLTTVHGQVYAGDCNSIGS